MNALTRRSFLKSACLVPATLGLSPRSWAQVPGANSDIRVAVIGLGGNIGLGGRGGAHLNAFNEMQGVRLAALCDCDTRILESGIRRLKDKGREVAGFADIRKLLESKTVDAVSVATPNHWHALATVWACQAGKDVYVEKPVSHNVWEGRQAVIAARKYNRIAQAGTQSRSRPGVREVIAELHAGKFGRIKLVRGCCYKPRLSIGKVDGPQPIPPGLDYDLWCGPAPMKPLRRKNLHYDWHWFYDTGNGDLGNQGVHEVDLGRWGLNEPALPPRVLSIGGRFGYEDDGETPNTQVIFFDYPTPFIFEVRGLPRAKEFQEKGWAQNLDSFPGVPDRRGVGVVVYCEQGTVLIPSESSPILFDRDGKKLRTYDSGGDHFANFIQAVRSRKKSDLTADIQEGHVSSALCHLGLISHRGGQLAAPDKVREQIQSSHEATESYGRFQEHLAANGVKLDEAKATLGSWLKVDRVNERLIDTPAADALLTREYRKPFAVPEKV